AACAACHAGRAASQAATAMARTAMPAHDSAALRDHTRLTFSIGPYTHEIATNDRGSSYTVSDGGGSASAPLAWAFGVGKPGQSFLFEKDGAMREARVSYYESLRALDFTPGRRLAAPRSLDEAMSRPVGPLAPRPRF